jgi:hypothetical protein
LGEVLCILARREAIDADLRGILISIREVSRMHIQRWMHGSRRRGVVVIWGGWKREGGCLDHLVDDLWFGDLDNLNCHLTNVSKCVKNALSRI